MAPAGKPRKWLRWTVAGVVAVLVIVVGAPFVYIHFIEPDPEKTPTLADTPTTALQAGETRTPLAGTWKITNGSVVQYRVKEVLFGQDSTATGSTKSITGSMKIAGTQVDTASFSVDMTTVTSDKSVRDGQFQGRIMDTAQFPTATFELSNPIELGAEPKDGVKKTYPATGKLTLHGTAKDVTFQVIARRTANLIAVQGNIPVTFTDYGIDDPSGGPASVGNVGQLAFVLQFAPS